MYNLISKKNKDIILDGEVLKPKQQHKLDPLNDNMGNYSRPPEKGGKLDPIQLNNLEKRFDLTESY